MPDETDSIEPGQSNVPIRQASEGTLVSGARWGPPLLLAIVGIVILLSWNGSEWHYFGDEMRHGMNGVFFRDFLVDLPLRHPFQYTYEYYAKYPALAVAHWPPFFHLVEGIFFLLLGISVWTSQFVVMLFALLGVYFWYRIAERFGPAYRAWLSALIFALLPIVLLYETVVMIEIPGISLCLGAIFFCLRFLDTEKPRDLWALAGFTVAALLTSQKSIVLVFIIVPHFLIQWRFRLLRRKDVWVALGISLALVLPWYFFTFQTLSVSYDRAFGTGSQLVFPHLKLDAYVRHLPRQLGYFWTALSVAGLGLALVRHIRRYGFLLLWVASTLVCFTLIREKDVRHTMIWIPPLIYFGLLAIEVLFARRRLALVVSGVAALAVLGQALRYDRPYLGGMDEVASFVLSQPDSDIIYYQGSLNGNFIYQVRKLDPQKTHMVAREKQVVTTKIVYGSLRILHTEEQVLNFFRTWGIRYAVVENRDFAEGFAPVRQVLNSDAFEHLRTIRLRSTDLGLQDRRISVYRLRGELQRTDAAVEIPMLTLRGNIRVRLSRVAGSPWPN